MSLIIEDLRALYLEDLEKSVDYDGKVRQKVYNVEAWKAMPIVTMGDRERPVINNLSTTSNVWVWSDTHFGHKNIIKYCDRPYPDIRLMLECLIGNYQSVVKPEDICIWVGDVGFMGDVEINNILTQLNGYKILVVGNHDFHHGKLRNLAFDETHLLYYLRVDDEDLDLVFTHYPQDNLPVDIVNIHGHTHNRNTNVRQQINVSVEVIGYKPINLTKLITEAKQRVSIYKNND